jgi:hypothetical protein
MRHRMYLRVVCSVVTITHGQYITRSAQ